MAHFFLVLNNILFPGHTTIYLSIGLHVSCFQVLAIINKTAINMCAGFAVDMFFFFSFFFALKKYFERAVFYALSLLT